MYMQICFDVNMANPVLTTIKEFFYAFWGSEEGKKSKDKFYKLLAKYPVVTTIIVLVLATILLFYFGYNFFGGLTALVTIVVVAYALCHYKEAKSKISGFMAELTDIGSSADGSNQGTATSTTNSGSVPNTSDPDAAANTSDPSTSTSPGSLARPPLQKNQARTQDYSPGSSAGSSGRVGCDYEDPPENSSPPSSPTAPNHIWKCLKVLWKCLKVLASSRALAILMILVFVWHSSENQGELHFQNQAGSQDRDEAVDQAPLKEPPESPLKELHPSPLKELSGPQKIMQSSPSKELSGQKIVQPSPLKEPSSPQKIMHSSPKEQSGPQESDPRESVQTSPSKEPSNPLESVQNSPLTKVNGNVDQKADHPLCQTVDLTTSRFLTRDKMYKISYLSGNEIKHLNLVKEIESHWEDLADAMNINPEIILADHNPKYKPGDYSRWLLNKMIDECLKHCCYWGGIIDALKITEGLDRVAIELSEILDCLNVDREDIDAIKRSDLQKMSCSDTNGEKKEISLIKKIAPHWRRLAKTVGIDERLIIEGGIMEACAYDVLTKLFDRGYKGSLTWQGFISALEASGPSLERLVKLLKKALNCVYF